LFWWFDTEGYKDFFVFATIFYRFYLLDKSKRLVYHVSMINIKDLKIESYPVTNSGGQYVSVVHPGVQVTHISSGLIAICSTERSQTT
jgi:protein subunit release factor B